MMQRFRNFFALPLLAKDLTERAARPRTFVLRIVFGLLFIGIFWIFMSRATGRASHWNAQDGSLMALLGMGRGIFDQVVFLLLWAIALFQPALMAGVITHEKERETLSLLFLADMKPWRLLVQKFLGGLLPMASLLLYGLPLAAIAYTYGGVTPGKMFTALLVVGGTWLQIGAFSLLCSAWFRTTTSATVAAYLFGVVGIFGADYALYVLHNTARDSQLPRYQVDWRDYRISPMGAFGRIYHGYEYDGYQLNPVQLGSVTIPSEIVNRANSAAPLFITSLAFLVLARCCLVRRAFSAPRHTGRRLFGRMDRWFEKLNGYFGGLAIGRGKDHSLPDSQPVLWRETSRGILGRAQHLVRLGVVVHAVIWLVLILGLGRFAVFAEVLLFLGVLAVAAVSVQSIGAERTRQTLDILLTTPVTAREIVFQKSAAARRLGWIFIANLIFLAVVRMWFDGSFHGDWPRIEGHDAGRLGNYYAWFHLACILLGLPLFFALVRWFSMWISVRFRNRNRAFQTCLALLALWCATPVIVRFLMPESSAAQLWSAALSPQGLLYINDKGAFHKLGYVDAGNLLDDAHMVDRQTRYRAGSATVEPPSLAAYNTVFGALVVLSIHYCFVFLFRRLSLGGAERQLRRAD
jgi:ABC-type transport system involved in multi-copper enzyme maturation permease subunit